MILNFLKLKLARQITKNILLLCAATLFLMFVCEVSFAVEVQDGFNTARKMQSKYFTIYVESGVDLQNVTMAISVPPSIKAIIRKPTSEFKEFNITNQFDLLFLAISEIMDIRLKTFDCKIKICRDFSSMSSIISKLYGQKMPKTAGVYVAGMNTMYVDGEKVDINVIAHEMSHAIQCRYFVVPPSERIQEVLSGFVEYQIRKYSNTLPKKRK